MKNKKLKINFETILIISALLTIGLILFLPRVIALVNHFDILSIFAQKIPETEVTYTLPNNQPVKPPDRICNIKKFGATAEDPTKAKENRLAIQSAINSCVDEKHSLFIPAGNWFTGSLYFSKNTWLILNKEATLSFVYNPELYRPLRPSRFEGYELINFSAPLYFDHLNGGGIIGGGKIKIVNPEKWYTWDKKEKPAKNRLLQFSQENVPLEQRVFDKVTDGLRPPFLQLYNVENFVLDNFAIENSTSWTIHALYSQNLLIQNLNIFTNGPNTDGIVLDSSTNAIVKNNVLNTGDDAIVLKSGSDEDGRRIARPTEKILIEDNFIKDAHGAVVIGSEMTGGVQDITIKNIKIEKGDIGLRLKTRPGRGGFIRNVNLDHLEAQKLREELLKINAHYKEAIKNKKSSPKPYPTIENITAQNLTAETTNRAIFIDGLKENPFKNIHLQNITAQQSRSSHIKNTVDPDLQNIDITFMPRKDAKKESKNKLKKVLIFN